MRTLAYLALGSNLGDKEANIRQAVRLIEERVGSVERLSSLHATRPWGFRSDNMFVNAAVAVSTGMDPLRLLRATQDIERLMGRNVKSVNGIYHDRIIDIDILLYGDIEYHSPELTIPHPLMYERDFVMIPLREIMK